MSRVRANQFTDKAGTGAPTFTKGAIVTGVATATSFTGDVTGDVTGNVTGNLTGAVTGNVTGNLTGNVTGNVTGDASGSSGSCTGNAATATVATNAQGLTGTPSITVQDITGVGATFTGNVSIGGTLTYEDVTNIDSVGIVTAREGIFLPDNKRLQVGNAAGSADLDIYHNGSNTYIENGTGNLMITGNNTDKIHIRAHASKQEIVCFPGAGVQLFHNDTKTFETTNLGAKVTGDLEVTGVTTASSYSGRHAEVPKNAKTGAYTLLKTDSGQCISTNSAVTVPNAVFASGDAITIFNDSSSAIALTQGSGLQLRKAGTTTTGSLSIKEFGLVTIWFNTGGTAIASGNLA